VLARANLISAHRAGRTIRYRAELDGIRALVAFPTVDCCAGHPEVCAPLVADLSQSLCLPPAKHEVRHD
jgi:ArsR family transcriptional regulator, arsenate/arsenite/antimonite-responsive transcriptional repressor